MSAHGGIICKLMKGTTEQKMCKIERMKKMKKKLAIWVTLIMGAVIIFSLSPTTAEATTVSLSGPNVQVHTVKKQTCILKGEVKVTGLGASAPRKAKITVVYQGLKYRDCCAKLLRSEKILDEKGNPTGEYNYIYSFCGCKIR